VRQQQPSGSRPDDADLRAHVRSLTHAARVLDSASGQRKRHGRLTA
jgi:hypothetical protein